MTAINSFKNVIDELEQGIIFLDSQLKLLYLNKWVEDYSKINAKEAIGKNFVSVFPKIAKTRIFEGLTDALIFGLSSYISASSSQSYFDFYKHGLHGIEFYRVKQVIFIKPYVLENNELGCQILIQDASENVEREATLNKISKELSATAHALSCELEVLSTVLNSTTSAIIGFDSNGTIELANSAVEQMFGYDMHEIKRLPFYGLFQNSDQAPLSEHNIIDRIARAGHDNNQQITLESLAYKKDGTPFFAELQIGAKNYEKNDHFIAIVRDVTERIHTDRSLKDSETRFKTLTSTAPVGIFYTDLQGCLHDVNAMWGQLTGLLLETVCARHWHDVVSDRLERRRVEQLWLQCCQNGETLSTEFSITSDSGTRRVLCQIMEESDSAGERIGYVGTLTDITAQHELRHKIETLAYYDPLTSLANRRLFRDQLSNNICDITNSDRKLALLILDLDYFKRINDSLGHDSGDILLVEVARRLKQFVRKEDFVARLGGDEFVIILGSIKSADNANMIAEKILLSLKQPIQLPTQNLKITASIGIAIGPDDTCDASSLIKYADIAMYSAKSLGRNRIVCYTQEMSLRIEQQLVLEHELNVALTEQQFFLLYQPQYDVGSGQFIGMEALIRWQSPARGLVPPDVFIEVAEQSGQIMAIGDWVLFQACHDMKHLLDSGLVDADKRVSVNLSTKQFLDPRLPYVVYRALQQSGLPARNLELEITESMLMENIDTALSLVRCLKGFGVYLAIDDFGTGYSSLGYLKQLPVDTLKIDRCFINDLVHSDQDKCIVSAVIAMAHKLNLMVIAEGIETEDQLEFLRENACDFAQGFYMSKPVSIDMIKENLSVHMGQCLALKPALSLRVSH